MGVPTFYRWLCNRYPRVPKDLVDNYNDRNLDLSDEDEVGLDLLSPNPNGEFDNLYLDMNGIIHPCCHPENMEQPESEEIMFKCIMEYIDRIFYLVRPRKLIYLAIDGVAPRAKINQQRSRRFKSAALADLEDETYEKMLKEYLEKRNDMEIPVRKNKWDSNVITPGTEFMYKLSNKIVEYIKDRVEKYDAWRRIVIIFSDSNVPGEGEHKIMEFIRSQRHCPDYDPNTTHVLHGMDADLIMLGLTTHEPNFYILREIVTFYVHASNKIAPNEFEDASEGKGAVALKADNLSKEQKYMKMMRENWKPLQLLQLSVLREYLSHQLKFVIGFDNGNSIDFERCVDDLVLMIFFCGNDFLPNLPSISITGGSIDQMILLYQKLLPSLNDYLSNEGNLNFHSISTFFHYLSKIENETFKQIYEYKRKSEEYHKNKAEGGNGAKYSTNKHDVNANVINDKVANEVKYSFSKEYDDSNYVNTAATTTIDDVNAYVTVDVNKVVNDIGEVIASINEANTDNNKDTHITNDNNNVTNTTNPTNNEVDVNTSTNEVTVSTTTDEAKDSLGNQGVVEGDNDSVNKEDPKEDFMKRYEEELNKLKSVDDVKLSVDVTLNDPRLWKEAYYRDKFQLTEEDDMKSFVREVSFHYIKGICWVLQYYYQGCPSWSWYYPYHYSPFCSDLEFETLYSHEQAIVASSEPVSSVSVDGTIDGGESVVHTADRDSGSVAAGDNVADNVTLADGDCVTDTNINILTTADRVTGDDVYDVDAPDNTVLSKEEDEKKVSEGIEEKVIEVVNEKPLECVDKKEPEIVDNKQPEDVGGKGEKRKKEEMALIKFDYGTPLTPFQQLMGVMPIRSSHCIPESLRSLMTDPESPLRDFYPVKFKEDPNGKRYKYQWVALLPFIDEEKLLHYVKPIEEQLSEHEKYRNRVSKNIIFLTPQLRLVFINQINRTEKVTDAKYEVKDDEMEYYICKSNKKHKSVLLKGVKIPATVLTIQDLIDEQRNRGFNCEVAKRMILNMLSSNRGNRDPFGTNHPEGALRDTARDYHQYHNQYNPNQYTPTQINQHGGHYQGNYRGSRHQDNYRDNHYSTNYRDNQYSTNYRGNQYQTRQHQGSQYPHNQYQGSYQQGKHGGNQYQQNHHQNQYGSQYRQNQHGSQYQGSYRGSKHQENYRDNKYYDSQYQTNRYQGSHYGGQYESNKYHSGKYQNQYGTNKHGNGHYPAKQYGGNQHHQGSYQTKYHSNHPDPYGSSTRNHSKYEQTYGSNHQYGQAHTSHRYGGQYSQNHHNQQHQHYGKNRQHDGNISQHQNFRNPTSSLKRSTNEKYY